MNSRFVDLLVSSLPTAFSCLVLVGGIATDPARAADDCTVKVKSCVPAGDGSVSIDVFNGNDAVHMVPASSSRRPGFGEVVTLHCNHDDCDVFFSIDRNGTTDLGYKRYDECKNYTIQHQNTGPDYTAYTLKDRLETCNEL